MNKKELLVIADALENKCTAPGCFCDGLIRQLAAATLRNLAALEPVAMVHVGLSATEIRFINQPRESEPLYNLTGIIDHE